MERLLPEADRIGELVMEEQSKASAVLQIVRYFGPDDGPDSATEPSLLGWTVVKRVLDFLSRTHAEIDIDEYGM